ncbi:MAG: CopG family transcriptional regulator [Thermofilum sp.]
MKRSATRSVVVSVKVPRELKEKMDAYASVVNWAEEIRGWIARRVEELERAKAVEEALKMLNLVAPAPRGTARLLVREDRDSH